MAAGKETPQVPETTRVVDGITYVIRNVPARNNQHRIGVDRRPLRWTPAKEISAFDRRGRSEKPSPNS